MSEGEEEGKTMHFVCVHSELPFRLPLAMELHATEIGNYTFIFQF